ncbi:MAG: mechanosensitive ion channel family protein [candidate division NC10 bacterium]
MRNDLGEIMFWLKTSGLRLVVIGIGSILLVRLLRVVADRILRLMTNGGAPAVTEREKRARTLASLLRTVGTTLVLIVAVMMALREIGLDITPLIAGAGVAGLAIGFGAQSLIKDIVAGFFILLEDQFHVGDVIQAGGVSGQVERMTLRMTIVRDLQGTVHFIPNGEIKVASNLTKEWSRAVLEIGVGYEEDVDRVMAVLTEVGHSLADDETFGKLVLEPPQVLGVEALADSQVTIRMLAKTLPLKQWEVARELRRRIKARFDREGIQIPYPHRVIITRSIKSD